ncbi:MAG TPA: hypothetical protein VGM51_15375 [Armatimonadota bacterium]|jgi:hypothetical protein
MIRLFWKEANEQFWFALAAIASPVITLAYMSYFSNTQRWPTEHSEVLLIYAVFLIWGARSFPGERDQARMTLATIPVPRWQVWVAKTLPAVLIAFATASLAWQIGQIHFYDSTNVFKPGVMATGFTFCFSAGFLMGAAVSAPLAAVLAGGVVTLGMYAVNLASRSLPWTGFRGVDALRWERLIWAETAVLLLAALAAVAWRGGLLSPRKARWPVALATLLVTVPGAMCAYLCYPRSFSPFPGDPLLASRNTGWIAYTDFLPHPRTPQPGSYALGLWVMHLDGSNRRLINDESAAPVLWLGTGELLYAVRKPATQVDRFMAWNPRSGRSRFVLSAPMNDTVRPPWLSLYRGLGSSWYATEPHGTRFALFRKPQSRLQSDRYDLWLVDAATSKARLLAPSVSADAVYWRGGRIFIAGSGLKSISPSGGPLRDETLLPSPDKEDSR